MDKCKEIKFCRNLFFLLGREEKVSIIRNSNLTDKETDFMLRRFCDGLTIKELAEKINLGIDATKWQQKVVCKKFYAWLEREARERNIAINDLEGELLCQTENRK